ncbi:MAG: hypothetical protein DWQ36_20415 [Acidobacteria bacterium]|nr:MAG: hypothetical protein DWQ30_20840 [Acidobacteriota bacterium]REK03234.1 MAG: hypothetical protein DWQ36_20415 [Acidobacteriota bacterium]
MVVLALSAACTDEERPRLQTVDLKGDAAVIADLRGSWYDWGEDLGARIESSPARLTLLVPPGFSISDARTVGGEIRFSFEGEGYSSELSLRQLEPGVLLLARPGEPPSGCGTCTPVLVRLRMRDLVRQRLESLPEVAAGAWQSGIDWLAERV